MNKKIAATLLFVACLTLAGAREFWIHPVKFFYNKGEKLEVSFKVGENLIGAAWDVKRDQIETLALHQIANSVNLLDSVKEGARNNLSYPLNVAGTHLLVMQHTNVFIERSTDEFNAYIKEGGLEDILDQQKSTKTVNASVKEYYSWHTKLLFQVGTKLDDTYKKEIGFPLEIIPEKNPIGLRIGEAIRFKLLFDGKPIFGARARVWNRFDNRTTIQNIYTEKDGTFEVRISNSGSWMISAGKMISVKQAEADWQSYWGSLVFGVK